MNNLSPLAQQSLALARREADRLNHHFVAVEHVLLAMLKPEQSGARTLLNRVGVDAEKLETEVKSSIAGELAPALHEQPEIPYTPLLRKSLDMADMLAKEMNATYVGTQHLLVAMVRLSYNPFVVIFEMFGADAERFGIELQAAGPDAFQSEEAPV